MKQNLGGCNSLEEYIQDTFPIKDLSLKITAVAGYQSGKRLNAPNNLINKKINNNIWEVISDNEDPLNASFVIEFSSPENIAKEITKNDFKDFFDLQGNTIRKIILINYRNKEEIGKIDLNYINYNKKQEEYSHYKDIGIYAKEIKIINNSFFENSNEEYISTKEPLQFEDYRR